MRIFVLGLVLALFWVALSGPGIFNVLLVVFGVLSLGLSLYMAQAMRTVDEEGVPLQALAGTLAYTPWLLWEIVKSSWTVAQIVLNPRLPISPTMTEVAAGPKTDVGLSIYANSITLTPGTLTVLVDTNHFTVHALTAAGADDVESGDMDRRVRHIEGNA